MYQPRYTHDGHVGSRRQSGSYPGLTIAGGSDEADASSSVRRTVRILLASGALRPLRGRVTWGGYGSGHACSVCGQPVGRSEVEYEVDDGRPGCHFACFVVWHEESRAYTKTTATPARPVAIAASAPVVRPPGRTTASRPAVTSRPAVRRPPFGSFGDVSVA